MHHRKAAQQDLHSIMKLYEKRPHIHAPNTETPINGEQRILLKI